MAAIAALDDDVRRALYECVRAAGRPITREEAATAVGISRKLAAFHLDKLVDLKLLRSGFRTGPARRVGRAPRLYEPANDEIAVRLPERTPELLAAILIEAVTQADDDEPARDAAQRIARQRGTGLGMTARRRHGRPGKIGTARATRLVRDLLAEQGFQPYQHGPTLRLRNCPFHALAAQAPEVVCGLNHQYLTGVITGLGVERCLAAALAPRPGECCVQLHRVN